MPPSLSLLVLRVASLDRASAFYGAIGIAFDRHRHGTGPEHLAATLKGGTVLELYPRRTDGDSTSSLRIGFSVSNVSAAFASASAVDGATIVSSPQMSEWGQRAVIKDPDGHVVELTAAQ